MFYRDTIQSPAQQMSASGTVNEFDNLGARMSAWALREHNEDGTHNLRPSGFDFVPIGSMLMWPTASAPSGWLICDGSQVSRTTYVALFTLLGTVYGVGDSSTTFNLPDFRQRFPLGKAAAGTGSVLGSTGGTIDHTHTGPSHTHTSGAISGATGSTAPGTDSQGSHSHTGSTGSESAHTHGAGSYITNDGSNLFTTVTAVVSGVDVSLKEHTHIVSGTSGAGSAHSHSISSDGAHTHTVNSHTHAAGTLVSADTGASGTGTTGTANPPYLSINFIIAAGV